MKLNPVKSHNQSHICSNRRYVTHENIDEEDEQVSPRISHTVYHCGTVISTDSTHVCLFFDRAQKCREREKEYVCPSVLVVPGTTVCRNAGDG